MQAGACVYNLLQLPVTAALIVSASQLEQMSSTLRAAILQLA